MGVQRTVEARQWALQGNERKKQQYNKRNTDYWACDLQESRKKKRKALRYVCVDT